MRLVFPGLCWAILAAGLLLACTAKPKPRPKPTPPPDVETELAKDERPFIDLIPDM